MNKKLIMVSDKGEMDWTCGKFDPPGGTETISYEDYKKEIGELSHDVKSIDDLPEVCHKILDGYYHTYSTIVDKVGLRIMNYDDMLFPQYENKFEKTIPRHIFESLQKAAKEKLAKDNGHAHPDVIEHWIKITEGEVPFGYTIKED